MLEQLGVEPADVDLDPVGDAAVDQRLVQRLVGVRQADIFADDADRHLAFGVGSRSTMSSQRARSGAGASSMPKCAQHLGVEPRFVILRRHGVDARRVERRDHRFRADVAEQGDLGALAVGQRAFAAAEEDVGLDAEAGQLADAVLGRLGLQLAGGGDVGDQRGVDRERCCPRPSFVPQLADRLDERQALDVADGAADLAEDEVEASISARDELLDRVGDVRDHLDGGAEIVAAPLAGDDVLVDAARGDVVDWRAETPVKRS